MSNERIPAPGDESSSQWERLVSELRACKESQRRTWGDLDDVTLGRYLAGEASSAESARVESELGQRAELRRLTDLVRDVLGELGPAESAPGPAPRLLSFEKAPPRRRRVLNFVRRRSSLVAAACLLIVLGVAMPNPGYLSAPLDDPGAAPEPAVAMRGMAAADRAAEPPPPPPPAPRAWRGGGEPAPASRAVARVTPRGKGKRKAPQKGLTPEPTLERVVALQREGHELRRRGDLAAAQSKLVESYHLCKDRLGEDHQATRNSVCSLADVYALGLNAGPSASVRLPMPPARGGAEAVAATDSRPAAQPSIALATQAPLSAAKALPTRLDDLPLRQVQEQVVPVLAAAVERAASAEKRRTYLRALAELGPAARSALPVLTRRLEDGDDGEEMAAVLDVLRRMGPAADSAGPAVTKLQDKLRAAARQHARIEPGQTIRIHRLANELKGTLGRIGVNDAAGCFSLGAVRDGWKQLAQLARSQGVEVFVQTGPASPDGCAEALRRMGPHAVCLAIDPEAPAVTVKLSEQLRQQGFDAERLRATVLAACREGKFDQGLADGIRLVQAAAGREKKRKP